MPKSFLLDGNLKTYSMDMVPPENLGKRYLLNPATIRTFLNTVDRWKMEDNEVRLLLGGMSTRSYSSFKKGGTQVLSGETINHISCLLFVSRVLSILYGGYEADKWMRESNMDEFFEGKTPLNYLTEGGLQAFMVMRENFEERLKAIKLSKRPSLKRTPTRKTIQWNLRVGEKSTPVLSRSTRGSKLIESTK